MKISKISSRAILISNSRRNILSSALLFFLFLPACSHVAPNDSDAAIYDAWNERRSRVEVTAAGEVVRLLGVRRGPSGTHEGFLLRLRGAGGRRLTVKVEDNVDVTGLVPLQAGDDVEVRGEYVYDPRGGIIHYTHHDPRGVHPSGYIRVRGRIYA